MSIGEISNDEVNDGGQLLGPMVEECLAGICVRWMEAPPWAFLPLVSMAAEENVTWGVSLLQNAGQPLFRTNASLRTIVLRMNIFTGMLGHPVSNFAVFRSIHPFAYSYYRNGMSERGSLRRIGTRRRGVFNGWARLSRSTHFGNVEWNNRKGECLGEIFRCFAPQK